MDKLVKEKEWVPAANKYPIQYDWVNPPELKKKGHFSKKPKVTSTEMILKDPRLKLWPGPGTYKINESDFGPPKKKNPDKGEEKLCAFISEAQYRSI